MAEYTNTLQALRRAIAIEARMPFFRRFPSGYSEMESGSTTGKIVDSSLTQQDGFWNGGWFYSVETGEVSLIRSFQSNSNTLFLEAPLSTSPSVGDDYEIHSVWNASDIKHYINQAIAEAGRTWHETITDETLILQEDKLTFSLTGFARRPWIVSRIFIESATNCQRGIVQSAGASTLTVESVPSITTASDWRVSIYGGTGKGQLRTVQSVNANEVTVSSAWTTVPDTTSRYALWNTTDDLYPWVPMDEFRVDAKEYPDILYLNRRFESYWGLRMRIEYMAEPQPLSVETDTTIVPARFIVPMALSFLMGQRLTETKIDKEAYYGESVRYREMAEDFRMRNAPQKPDLSLRSPSPTLSVQSTDNPLNWPRR
jgi:hypothetical protein